MPKKHHAIYSDPTGAAAAASPVRRRTARPKAAEHRVDGEAFTPPETAGKNEGTVDREAIARLAYSYWEARGFVGGSPEEDWLRAERELRESLAVSATA